MDSGVAGATFGAGWLTLLGDDAMVAVVLALRRSSASTPELDRRLEGVPYDAARRRVLALGRAGFAEPARSSPGAGRRVERRRVEHRLTARGLALAHVCDVAAAWEDAHAPWRGELWRGTPGAIALRLLSASSTRAIARVLTNGALRVVDVEPQLTGLSHSAVVERLQDLARLGLLEREQQTREVRYRLTDAARRLVGVVIRAAWAECAYGDAPHAEAASDLAGIVHQIAPLARVSHVQGICALRERWPRLAQETMFLAASGGRLTAMAVNPAAPSDAEACGDPGQWAQALLGRGVATLEVSGSRELASVVVEALARVVSGEPPPPLPDFTGR